MKQLSLKADTVPSVWTNPPWEAIVIVLTKMRDSLVELDFELRTPVIEEIRETA